MSDDGVCPHCGEPLSAPGDAFCPECRLPVDDPPPTAEERIARRIRKAPLAGYAGVLSLIGVFGLLAALVEASLWLAGQGDVGLASGAAVHAFLGVVFVAAGARRR